MLIILEVDWRGLHLFIG